MFDRIQYFGPQKKEIMVLKEERGYNASTEPIYEHFIDQFKKNYNKNWMKMLEAMKFLYIHAESNKEIEKRIGELRNSQNTIDLQIYAYVFGELKKEEAREVLIEIMENEKEIYNLFDQMRAAYYLSHYSGKHPKYNYSYTTHCQNFLIDCLNISEYKIGVKDLTIPIQSAAAYHLANLNIKCKEALDILIKISAHRNKEIAAGTISTLQRLTDRKDIISAADWKSWWYANAQNYIKCRQDDAIE